MPADDTGLALLLLDELARGLFLVVVDRNARLDELGGLLQRARVPGRAMTQQPSVSFPLPDDPRFCSAPGVRTSRSSGCFSDSLRTRAGFLAASAPTSLELSTMLSSRRSMLTLPGASPALGFLSSTSDAKSTPWATSSS